VVSAGNGYEVTVVDTEAIQTVLEAGTIGDMPFPMWLEQAFFLDEPAEKIAKRLSDLGVMAVRWEPGESNSDPQRLWQAHLVVTLPNQPETPVPSAVPTFPLKLVHDIAVEICGSYFYSLKGRELWIEYLVAHADVRDAIVSTMEAGKIGNMPFLMWFRYHPASTNIKTIAGVLAAHGVAAVRWERDEFWHTSGVVWQAYLVATLPMSSSVSPPSLPSDRLLHKLVLKIPSCANYDTRVTESGVELWISFKISLPLEDPPGEIVVEDGISYLSFAGPAARRARARARRRELWRALVSFVKRN
jgi:hypothetical protein